MNYFFSRAFAYVKSKRHAILRAAGTLFLGLAAPAIAEPHYRLANGDVVAPLDKFQECEHCPEMIVMPMGSFMMGAIPGESRNPFDYYGKDATGRVREPDEINIIPNEHPRHRVKIDMPIALARNEVTRREWMACVAAGGCATVPQHWLYTPTGTATLGPDHPVIHVSFLDAQQYVAWLNSLVEEEVYRLPTEAEWEYGARAGTQTRFAQGDELTPDQANFSRGATENVRRREMPNLVSRYQPVPVEDLDAANAWGLRHMSGNVRELTLTCWTTTHLGLGTSSAYLDLARSETDCTRIVAKGGSFGSAMDGVRAAGRIKPSVTRITGHQGFRVLRDLRSITQ